MHIEKWVRAKEKEYYISCQNPDGTISPTKTRIRALPISLLGLFHDISHIWKNVQNEYRFNRKFILISIPKLIITAPLSLYLSIIERLVHLLMNPTDQVTSVLKQYEQYNSQIIRQNVRAYLPTKYNSDIADIVAKELIEDARKREYLQPPSTDVHYVDKEEYLRPESIDLYYRFVDFESTQKSSQKQENNSSRIFLQTNQSTTNTKLTNIIKIITEDEKDLRSLFTLSMLNRASYKSSQSFINKIFRNNLLSFTQLLCSKIPDRRYKDTALWDINKIESNIKNMTLDVPTSIQLLQKKITNILFSHLFSVEEIISCCNELKIPKMHRLVCLTLLARIRLHKQSRYIEQLFIIALLNKRFDLALRMVTRKSIKSEYLSLFILCSKSSLNRYHHHQNIKNLIVTINPETCKKILLHEYASEKNKEDFLKHFSSTYSYNEKKFIKEDYKEILTDSLWTQISNNQLEKALNTFDFFKIHLGSWNTEANRLRYTQALSHMSYEVGNREIAQKISQSLTQIERRQYNTNSCLYTDLYESITKAEIGESQIRIDVRKLWPFIGSKLNTQRIINKLSQAYLERGPKEYRKDTEQLNAYLQNEYNSEISITPLFYTLFSTLIKLHIQNHETKTAEEILKNFTEKNPHVFTDEELTDYLYEIASEEVQSLSTFLIDSQERRKSFIDTSLAQIAAGYLDEGKLDNAVRVGYTIDDLSLRKETLYDIEKRENRNNIIYKSAYDLERLQEKQKATSLFEKEFNYTTVLQYIEKGDLYHSERIHNLLNRTFA